MRKKGFTLMEMILVVAILGIVLASFSSVMISSSKAFRVSNDVAFMQNQSLIISRLIKNETKGVNSVTIYEEIPTFEDDQSYIYYNDHDKKIYIKRGTSQENILFDTKGTDQKVSFKKVDNNNFRFDVELENTTSKYVNKDSVTLVNASGLNGVFGEEGICISYSNVAEIPEPIITRVTLTNDLNENITTDVSATPAGDHTVTLNVDTSDVTELKPIVNTNDDENNTLYYIVGTNEVPFDINNPADNAPIDFSETVDFIVRRGEKENIYPVTVIPTETVVTFGEPHDLMSTTEKYYRDTKYNPQSASGIVNDIVMPNENDYLCALFDDETGYDYTHFVVNWYAIPPSDVEEMAYQIAYKVAEDNGVSGNLNQIALDTMYDYEYSALKLLYRQNSDDYFVTQQKSVESATRASFFGSSKDKSYANVLEVSKYYNEVMGDYVFYDFAPTDENGKIDESKYKVSIGSDEPIYSDQTSVQTFAHVGFKNGPIFETTMNELDFLYGSQLKQNSYLQSFNKMLFKTVNDSGYIDKSGNFGNYDIDQLKSVVKVKSPYENTGHDVYVDYVNRNMTLYGASNQYYDKNENYPQIGASQFGQYGLFSVNMNDKFYTDKKDNAESGVRIGIKNTVDSNGKPTMGGVAINPRSTSTLSNDNKVLYSEGYYVNYIYNKINQSQSSNRYHESGVNMNKSEGQTIHGNYPGDSDISNGQSTVGARNITNDHPEASIVPYKFGEISKNGYTVNPNDADIYMDINVDYTPINEWSTSLLYTVGIADRITGESTNLMYFGDYEDYFSGEKNYTFTQSNPLYSFEQTIKMCYDGSQNGDRSTSIESSYANVDTSSNTHMETAVSMWAYDPTDTNCSVTITELTPIE